ncbi:hypothetical protein [Methylobacterium radiotolerans]|uniref:Uncharacterized protein n=1 Tax=Methylobacterium radiotolerans (strain ATCC 27329 / DSM 1819 / JCM 2831 / NBRC 15690 / NCIMB 10815 / 0-1) TaxID=426355 RepID=B1M9X9_METRJ|nr:hypothetical protein [Methylobacterium radiotolerans]ACB28304.1 hypothetical protein Mrad2831_6383 [Methylobacterium radiotolerans JCM 2831]ACB28333.1 hypothetical protein Mrad2831_6413 [Methylobacterium radiotolerans JCM 2831]
MPYTLQRLAAGSYDLLLDGDVVGSVVRSLTKGGDVRGWYAELLEAAPPLPAPFTQEAHRFDTLDDTLAWLGGAQIEGGV